MTGQTIGKLNHFLSLKGSTEFLVFGNSRANRHIDVNLFSDNSFNMGLDGIGIAYTSTIINTLPKDTEQLILVHIDTKNLFDKDYDGSDIRGLKTKYQRDKNMTKALDVSGQLSILQRFYYSMNYNGNAIGIIKNYFKPKYDFTNYNGYDPISLSKSQEPMRDTVLSKAITDDKCSINHEINSLALDYLKSIKSFLEKSPKKTFLFVTSPIYYDACEIDNTKLGAIMQDLDLTYWDYTNLYKDTKDNSYWKDPSHMSKKGAEAFSKHLFEKYNAPKN